MTGSVLVHCRQTCCGCASRECCGLKKHTKYGIAVSCGCVRRESEEGAPLFPFGKVFGKARGLGFVCLASHRISGQSIAQPRPAVAVRSPLMRDPVIYAYQASGFDERQHRELREDRRMRCVSSLIVTGERSERKLPSSHPLEGSSRSQSVASRQKSIASSCFAFGGWAQGSGSRATVSGSGLETRLDEPSSSTRRAALSGHHDNAL